MAVIIYGGSTLYSIFLWRKGFRRDDRVNYLLLVGAFVFHTLAMFQRGFSLNRCPVNNLFEAILFVAWTMVAAYLVVGLWPRLRFLGVFASPVLLGMGVFALFPELDRPAPALQFPDGAVSLHAALALLAYGAFGLSSAAALMYLTQEHDLKFHKLRAVFSVLPPIQRLEVAISRLLLVGLVLLTAGLAITPYIFHQKNTGQPVVTSLFTDAKVLWSVLVWCLYGGLLVLHWRFAQSGRRLAWSALGAFAFVLLTFWGTQLLSGIHNP